MPLKIGMCHLIYCSVPVQICKNEDAVIGVKSRLTTESIRNFEVIPIHEKV